MNRHSRLVFTRESPFSVDDSTVTLTFKPVSGGTLVNMHHVNHEDGWTAILAKLGSSLIQADQHSSNITMG